MLLNCKVCNKEFRTYPSVVRKGRKYCSRECMLKSEEYKINKANAQKQEFRGTTHQIHNVTHNLFENPLKCSICNSTNRIAIHHKDKNRLNNDISNLIPLCNKCHTKHHFSDLTLCEICGRIKGENHICPTKEEYSIFGTNNIKKRERCSKCGKLLGFDKSKHSCKHPRGMLGKHHTEIAKQSMKEKCRKSKTEWWIKHKIINL